MSKCARRRWTEGFLRGSGYCIEGWRVLARHRSIFLVVAALTALNVLAQRAGTRHETHNLRVQPPQSSEMVRRPQRGDRNDLRLFTPYDPLAAIAAVPKLELRSHDSSWVSHLHEEGYSFWQSLAMIDTVLFLQLVIAALSAAGFVGVVVALAEPGTVNWRGTARRAARASWRYLGLWLMLGVVEYTMSLIVSHPGNHFSGLEVFGLYLALAGVRFAVSLTPIIVSIEGASLIGAILLSIRTVCRRLPEALVVVVGIGCLQYLVIGPVVRGTTAVWPGIHGMPGFGAFSLTVSILWWGIYTTIGTWFCLSAARLWAEARYSIGMASHEDERLNASRG